MLDSEQVEQLRFILMDRFTAEELCEILDLESGDIVDRFIEEILRTDWSEHL